MNVSCKVPPHVAELLDVLARMRGMQVYELLQLLVHGFISYAKAEHTVPEEFRRLYESLRFDVAWSKAYNFCSPSARQDIAQLVLIMQQPERSGFGMMMIDKPFMSDQQSTICVPDIYERVSRLALGERDYKRCRKMNAELCTQSVLDTVRTMLDAQEVMNIAASDREELPGMGDRTESGRVANAYGQKRKSVKHRTPDGEARQQARQAILFGDEDRQAAEREASQDGRPTAGDMERMTGFRPFTAEW